MTRWPGTTAVDPMHGWHTDTWPVTYVQLASSQAPAMSDKPELWWEAMQVFLQEATRGADEEYLLTQSGQAFRGDTHLYLQAAVALRIPATNAAMMHFGWLLREHAPTMRNTYVRRLHTKSSYQLTQRYLCKGHGSPWHRFAASHLCARDAVVFGNYYVALQKKEASRP